MLNEEDYKPMVNELIDLTNQQRYLVENFLQRIVINLKFSPDE